MGGAVTRFQDGGIDARQAGRDHGDYVEDKRKELLMQPPTTVQPRANVDFREALKELESSREALRVAVLGASGLSLGEIKHTHPFLGELDLYQWLIFLGQHEGRHKKQIERTLNSIPE